MAGRGTEEERDGVRLTSLDQPLGDGPRPLRLETGDRLWRRLGREAHETAAALDPVWTALCRPQSWAR